MDGSSYRAVLLAIGNAPESSSNTSMVAVIRHFDLVVYALLELCRILGDEVDQAAL
jgi:hypothetical protein